MNREGTSMKQTHRNRLIALSCLTLLLSLGACDLTDKRTAGQQRDAAIVTETEQAARRAAEVSRAAASAAAAELKQASDEAGIVTAKAAESAREAVGRIADQLEDALIVAKVTTGLAADRNLTALRIKVDSRDGVVTLTGPAPTQAARARAEEIARNVKGVTSVNNQLTVSAG